MIKPLAKKFSPLQRHADPIVAANRRARRTGEESARQQRKRIKAGRRTARMAKVAA